MYCKECGKEIANNSKYCNYCGTLQSIEPKRNKFSIFNLNSYIYPFTLKKTIILFFVLVLTTMLFLFLEKYSESNIENIYNEESSQIKPLEQLQNIQRNFLGCCFGDTYEKVEEQLKSNGYEIMYVQTAEREPKRILLQPKLYSIGDYNVKYIDLRFYNDNFSFIQFIFVDNANFTFKGLKRLLNKKYSNVQVDSSDYSNFQTYSDDDTEIELKLSVDSEYNVNVVNLKYIDKDSGVIESLNDNF